STAGGQGGGPVTIRHGGGSQNTPFVVGDATTNGTAGAITTGENNTIAPVQSFPGSYTQGTPPNQIQIITQDQPNGGEIPNNSEVVEQPPAPPIQTEPQRPVDTIVDEIENYFTTQADKYVGGNTRIKTLDEIRNDLRQVEQATNGEIKPGVIYAFFSPRGPVVRPELDAEGFPRQPNIALEAPLQLVL
ncbi:MAG TPA: hypothetical protein DCL61_05960, partial [Cyanobacteria bacterium UBA12227]|nr:hypothetical protein [Cyanobacteria bacterium UBA12227]